MVNAGISMMSKIGYDQKRRDSSPMIGAGVYVTYPRINKHIAFESAINVSRYTLTYNDVIRAQYGRIYKNYQVKYTYLSIPLLVDFNLRKGNVFTPYISVGFNNTIGWAKEQVVIDDNLSSIQGSLFYPAAAIGVNIPIGNHTMRIGAFGSIKNGFVDCYESAYKVMASFIF